MNFIAVISSLPLNPVPPTFVGSTFVEGSRSKESAPMEYNVFELTKKMLPPEEIVKALGSNAGDSWPSMFAKVFPSDNT